MEEKIPEQLKVRIDELTEENEHLKRQVGIAVSLRYHLMPQANPAFPDHPQTDIYADQISLADTGGDFYDYFRIDSDHIGIVIADIFDGGDAAALYMVAFKLYLQREVSLGFPPEMIMQIVNNRLVEANEDDLCLSAWFGIYEESSGRISAVNAGHEPPLLRYDTGVRSCESKADSYLLAVVKDMDYDSYELCLKPGEMLLLYTDGVTIAQNPQDEMYGVERLIKDFAGTDAPSAEKAVGQLQASLFEFAEGRPFADDVSFLCLARK